MSKAPLEKLPQSEGADYFIVLDPIEGIVHHAYTADLGRSFGHEHIKDAQLDGVTSAARWVVRPLFATNPAAAAPVVLPEEIPASNTLWMFLTKGMTQSAIAGMPERDRKVLTERAQENWAAIRAEVGATVPVVLPEPWPTADDVALAYEDAFAQKPLGRIFANLVVMAEALQARRALLAGVSAPAAQAVEPTDAELIALNAGECYFGESPSKYPELGHGTQYHAGAPGVLGFARAALALRSDPAAYSQKFQQRVQPWMMTCFGPEISANRIERNHRFLEESLELVQSLGCTASEAHQLVDYVFGRPVGDPMQEAGGVMVTLAALCLASGLDMHACGETELARIWTKVEAIRAKQAAKPKHSPLPMHAPQAQADARDADGEAFRTAARLGLTLRFYGNCAQSGAPGTPSVYEVVPSLDRAAAMREAIQRADAVIAAQAAQQGDAAC